MPRDQSYMTRALRSSDPRYARVLSRLGYGRRDMQPASPPVPAGPGEDDLATLREEYERVLGKRPYYGWDAGVLREKIAAVQAQDEK